MSFIKKNESRKPIGTTSVPMKLVESRGRDGKTYENVKGSIKLPNGQTLSVEWNRDDRGTTDQKSGKKIVGWLKVALFENDGKGGAKY